MRPAADVVGRIEPNANREDEKLTGDTCFSFSRFASGSWPAPRAGRTRVFAVRFGIGGCGVSSLCLRVSVADFFAVQRHTRMSAAVSAWIFRAFDHVTQWHEFMRTVRDRENSGGRTRPSRPAPRIRTCGRRKEIITKRKIGDGAAIRVS